MTAIELLESLNLLDEHERVEAKRASEVGRSVLETVCARAYRAGPSGGSAAPIRDLHLSDEEAKALIVVREADAMDNATYRELNKVDTLATSGALRRLRDAGLLEQKGRGSATYYVPTNQLVGIGPDVPAKPGTTAAGREGLSGTPAVLPRESDDFGIHPAGVCAAPVSVWTGVHDPAGGTE